MLRNAVEKAVMNNPVRTAVQRRFEARRLRQLGGRMQGGRALELGCGHGAGVEIILDDFGADQVDAFDGDAAMIERARYRLLRRGARTRLWVGDTERIHAADDTYDAVFDFGSLHHVAAWRDAVREIARVLRPGGRFYGEEVLERAGTYPLWRRVLEHPMVDRFDCVSFGGALEDHGLRLLASAELWGQFGWFVAEKPN
ncbi:MAG: class I SAM-dependent methyltransferase [Kofleriaceae bacterium]|nr:class I SAM-dependent methyltransferase [Myxococcales bacterium]MCB9561214.1 class I SAM-dependent methyltransferase [Kofleriaceae bacterium]